MSSGSAGRRIVIHLLAALLLTWPLAVVAEAEVGRRLFELGAADPPVLVEVGGLEFDATRFPCKGCHGERGEGRREGGLVAPPIDWQSLARPTTGFRARLAYDQDGLMRALTIGIDPVGRALDSGMPRFRTSKDQLAALVEHLQGLSRDLMPGVDDDRVRVGFILEDADAMRSLTQSILGAAQAGVAEENRKGGAYGRRIELITISIAEGETVDVLVDRLKSADLFVVVAPFAPRSRAVLGQALAAADLVELFPLDPTLDPSDRRVLLHPSVPAQTRPLVEHWASQGGEAMLVADGRPLSQSAAMAVHLGAAEKGLALQPMDLTQVGSSGASEAQGQVRPRSIFYFGDVRGLEQLLSERQPPESSVRIYGLLDQISPIAAARHRGVSVVLANPHGAFDGNGRLEVRRLMEGSTRMAIYALAESLRVAGRRLSRSRMLESAQQIADRVGPKSQLIEFALEGK